MRGIGLLSLFVLAVGLPGQSGGPVVFVAPSLERIGGAEGPRGGTVASLAAARGEYESFQIVVRAPAGGALTNVAAGITDLAGPRTISRANFTLFREHYVNVSSSSPNWKGANRPLAPGWFADGLIPLGKTHFDVPAGSNQPVWVDVFVPRDAMAGQYVGTFHVSSDQGSAAGQISLKVWDFTLPLSPSLKTAFQVFQERSEGIAETLLLNKVAPLTATPQHARAFMDRFGLKSTNLGLWSGADVSHCSMPPPPEAETIRAAAARYPRNLDLLDYSADEVDRCTNLFPRIRQWGAALHKAGVKNLVTMSPIPELFDDGSGTGRSAVDIWVVLPKMFDKAGDRIRRALAKGDEVWSYNTLVQDAYSPKWEIDFAPINFRIQPGFISQSLGLTGLLYWRVDLWNPDPWKNVTNAGKFDAASFPGEGVLVYPGGAPSMRLKWIRDGVEDYEYVALLKKAGAGDWALEVARSAGRDWRNWTRDPAALEAARRKLGEKLDSLSKSR